MNRLLALVVLVGCGGGDSIPSATYRVSWSVTDTSASAAPTCASYKIADVVVTVTDTATGDTHVISVPCTAGMVETAAVPLGSHKVKLEAMGTAGDVAGSVEVNGALTVMDLPVMLASAAIPVAAPVAQAHASWTISSSGAASSCVASGAQGVRITLTPMGAAPTTDIWDCAELNATTAIPYGPFTAKAELLGVGDVTIGVSVVTPVDAGRGVVPARLAISTN